MSGTKEYKCSSCGGRMEFDSESQNMKCPYCGTEITVDEYEKTHCNAHCHAKNSNEWQEGETEGIKIYVCESCGGEILADETTGASSCPYCDNPVVIKGQFEGDLKPDYIIPFKLDKKAAKNAYKKHLENKSFLPRVFKSENHIDEIKGLYVPFWLYDMEVSADLVFNAERTHVYRSGDTEYTDHNHYEATRAGTIAFDNVPEDGSEKMDDTLMESVEPYDFNDAVPFKNAYLSGYLADRYDVDMDERLERARERVVQSTKDNFRETVTGYHTVTNGGGRVDVSTAEYSYALYPVWILNTTWNKEKYVFAMNGQTGRLVGDLPLDKGLFFKYVGIRGVILGAALYIAMYIINML